MVNPKATETPIKPTSFDNIAITEKSLKSMQLGSQIMTQRDKT